MIFRAPSSVQIPNVDLMSLLYDGQTEARSSPIPVWVDAESTQLRITRPEAQIYRGRIAHSLRHQYRVGVLLPPTPHSELPFTQDIVLVCSENNVALGPAMFGIISAGGVVATCATTATVSEVTARIEELSPTVVLCSKTTQLVVSEALQNSSCDCGLLIVDPETKDLLDGKSLKSVLTEQELLWTRITDAEVLQKTYVFIVYSSGTTGSPKGVCLSHSNIVSAISQMSASQAVHCAKMRATNIHPTILGTASCMNIAALMFFILLPLHIRATVYFPRAINFENVISLVRSLRISILIGAPPTYQKIGESDWITAEDLATIRLPLCGAGHLAPLTQKRANMKMTPGVCIISTYGATDASCGIAQQSHDDQSYDGSVGTLFANMSAKTLSLDGNELGPNEPGFLYLKGPNITKTYFKNLKANADTFLDGWFNTGDIARISASGKLFILGRQKERIHHKDLLIIPNEIEDALACHPAIADVAVVGRAIPGSSEENPRAYVVLKPAQDRSRQELGPTAEITLSLWIKEHMGHDKWLNGDIVFVDAIPKGPTGKVQRMIMKTWQYKDGIKSG